MPMMPDAQMMGGEAPMMGGDPMMGMMQGGPPPEASPQEAPDPLAHLRQAIEHAQAALVGEPDDADSQMLAKLVSGLYQILASRQKESDQALGNPNLARMLRR